MPYDYNTPNNTNITGINANYSNLSATGIAIGNSSNTISGDTFSSSIAIGDYTTAAPRVGGLSIAVGHYSNATGIGSVALGIAAKAANFNSLAISRQSAATADFAMAIGTVSSAQANASTAIGSSATTRGERAIAIGNANMSIISPKNGDNPITSYNGTTNTQANGSDSIALGTSAKAIQANSIAQGLNAKAVTIGSIAMGSNAVAGAVDGTGSMNFANILDPRTKRPFVSEAELLAYYETVKNNPNNQVTRSLIGKQNNIAIGAGAEATGGRNISVGESAGRGIPDQWNIQNVNIGTQAGEASKKDYSIAIGYQAGALLTGEARAAQASITDHGQRGPSVFIGDQAGMNTASYHNIAIGDGALTNVVDTNAKQNIAIGNGAGFGIKSNDSVNTAFRGFGSGANALIGAGAGRGLSGDGNIALGNLAGQYMVGDNNIVAGHLAAANSNSDRSVILGTHIANNTINDRNVLIGNWVNGTVGKQAVRNAVGIGTNLTVTHNEAIAVGFNSAAINNNAIAVGNKASASGVSSIAIGTGNNISADYSGAIGDPSVIQGAASYTMGNDNAIGATTSDAFAIGSNNQIGGTVTYVTINGIDGKLASTTDVTETTSATGSAVVGSRNAVNSENTFVLGSGINSTGTGNNIATIGSTVANSVYLGADSTATAGSAVGTKNILADGTEGATTTAGATGEVAEVTVGKTTYSNFAGATAVGVVTVGAAGTERRIQNVAAGEVSTTSTDAINGSQLYAVAKVADEAINKQNYFHTNTGKVNQPAGNATTNEGTVDAKGGAIGYLAIVAGINATATGVRGSAVGVNSSAAGEDSTALGTNSNASQVGAIAVGSQSAASNNGSVAVGASAASSGVASLALGNLAQATERAATAVGRQSVASGGESSAFGSTATATGMKSTAVGVAANASKIATVAIGANSSANFQGDVALGASSVTSAAVSTNTAAVGDVTYSGFAGIAPESTVSVGALGYERTITNVAAGRIEETSTDAINGSQLYAVADKLSQGFNITADNQDLNGETQDKVKLGETVDFTSTDRNIVTTVRDNEVDFGLSDNIEIGKNGKDGSIGVNGKDGKDGITITPDEITFHGRDGLDGKDGKLKLVDGQPGVDGANGLDGKNGKDGETTLRLEFNEKQLANLEDGLRFTGNNTSTENKHELNSLVFVQGEGVAEEASKAFKSAAGNINVVANGGNTLEIQLNKDIDLTKDGSLSFGGTTIDVTDNGSINLGKGDQGTTPVQIVNLDSGLKDKDGTTINLGDAKGDTLNNAVNVGDLKDAIGTTGFTLKADKTDDGKNVTADDKLKADGEFIGAGDTVTMIAGKNMTVEQTKDGKITYSTDDRVTFGGQGKDGKDGVDGKIAVNGKDGKDGITITPDEITFHGRDGLDGKDGALKLVDGQPGVNGANGLDGKDGETTLRLEFNEKQLANLEDGLRFTGNNTSTQNKHQLNSLVFVQGEGVSEEASKAFKSAAGNINVVANGGNTLEIQLNKDINLTKDGSLSFGDTKIDVTDNGSINLGKGDQGTTPVQIVNLDSGLKDKDGTTINLGDAKGDTLNNAVNVGDLQNAIGTTGFTLKADANGGENATADDKLKADGEFIGAGDTVTMIAGKNMTVEQTKDGKITYSTDDRVTFGGQGKDGKDGVDGKVGVAGKDGKDGITITPDAITFHGRDGLDGKDGALKLVDGQPGVNGANGLDGKDGETTLRLEFDGKQLANVEDGLRFTGNNVSTENKHQLNSLVFVQGEGVAEEASKAFKSAAGNINVKADGGNTLEIQLNKDIDLTDSGSLTIGGTTVNGKGLTINGGPSVTIDGINAGNKVITNVAPGVNGTDAVNVNQLKAGRTAVKAGTNIASVDMHEDKVTGKVTYTVNAEGTNVKAGNSGNVIVATSERNKNNDVTYTVDIAQDLNVNSVTTGDTVLNDNGLTIKNGPSVTKVGIDAGGVKITNVAAGTDPTDAVNVSQLDKAAAAAKTEVKAGTNVTVSSTTGDEGQTVYTVNADGTSVSSGDTDYVAVTKGDKNANNVTDYKVDLSKAAKEKIDNALQSFTTSVNGTAVETINKDNNDVGFVNGTNTTARATKNGDITFDLNDDIKLNSVTANKINVGPVTIDGEGINAGSTKITNVKAGTEDGDAVNFSQLKQVVNGAKTTVDSKDKTVTVTSSVNGNANHYDLSVNVDGKTITKGDNGLEVNTTKLTNTDDGKVNVPTGDEAGKIATAEDVANAINNSGWNLSANGGDASLVKPGDTVDFAQGKNIEVKRDGNNITVATKDDVHFNSVQFGDISPTGDRTGPKIQANSNGDLKVGGNDDAPVKITNVAKGEISATSTDAVNGSQLYDTNTQISKGLNFAADYATSFNRQLGDTVTFRGGAEQSALTNNNIGIIANNGTIDVKLAKDLKGLSTAEFTDGAGNVTNIGGNGVSINPAGNQDPSRVVSLTSGGLNNGGNRITNVAPGVDGTDAVNVDQLKGAVNHLAGNINKVDRNARAGIAGALATAGLPQAYLPGKSLFAVGAGTYRGETGLAIGLSSISDGGNWIIKGTANADSRGHFGASAAIGYQW